LLEQVAALHALFSFGKMGINFGISVKSLFISIFGTQLEKTKKIKKNKNKNIERSVMRLYGS